ncbi:fibrous sheath-interacting protein 2-like [Rhinolophus sinicus]|uniref:fibrous sheath-interacting protein 2-like n=1 Tax=Rhinolophus sinicus TaxID=89399 RepID=UPI003D7A9039
MSEIKNLKNIFVNFKCHLKAQTELILERIFEEITSDLTRAIPCISSVTAEVFVDQSEPEKTGVLSNADISSVASEIVENMLEKLQSAVEKKCFEMFLPEDLSVDIKPSLTPSGEYLTPPNGKRLEAPRPYPMKPMCDITEDMVHAILQQFMTLARCKQDELPHLGDPTKLSYQQHMTNQTCTFLKKADKKKCSLETDEANLTFKELQNLVSNICSQSSLVGYIEEAISATLGYIQTELNSERLTASEETVVLLQLLDIFTQLHQDSLKADGKKCRRSRLSNSSDPEGKYRITGNRLPSGSRSRKPFPPINVPGMVLYSEDDNEQIDKIVENVLDSSFKEEKAKSQKQNPEDWFTKEKTCFEYKRISKPPTKPAYPRSKVAFYDGGLKSEFYDGGLKSELHTQIPVATDNAEDEEEIPGPDFEINNEEKIDKTRENSFKKEDNPIQLSFLTSKVRNTGTTTEKTEKRVTQKPNIEERKEPPPLVDINEQYPDYEHVQNITENIYDNILGYSQESSAYSNLQSPSSDTAYHVIQEVGKDFAKSVTTKYPSLSINKNLPAKEKKEEKETEKERERERENKREKQREREEKRETEKVKAKGIKTEPSKPYHPHYPPKSKPGIFPAKFLEDVITEMVNKLIFSTSPKTQTYDIYQNVSDDKNQAELYDTAMKLTDSLLKEFSKAQIKVFRPDKENQFFPSVDKESSIPNIPPKHKESTTDEASPSIKKITVDKMPHMHKVTKKPSLNNIPFLDKIPAIDKTLVNKVVHSSLCNILKEYRSQDSIFKNIKSNGENLARRLTSAVINEIFQHQLNLLFSDEVPASACLPLESKDVVIKVQKVAQAASKECQTSSPYTIMLPHEFLENVISALLSKIFSTLSKNKAETAEGKWLTELDFLQMKLLSTVTTELSKNKDLIIQYVECLHPNDGEIIQLVAHSIYNNLFSQFGTQEVIQNCVASGCVIVSKTIVDLVLREVAGNQLQNYFSGELTPHQCAEVDSVVENILKDVIQTISAPQPQPSRAHLLPYNIIEETAVKFLSKLLSMFAKVDKERTNSLETEMQKITSKILNSIQEFISRSKIKLIPPAKKLTAITLADNESIDKVVNSVYTSVLKHSGSHTCIFKDLMGKSNVLSDIIGFLMVKELSNSEFKPQVEEEVSSSELVLEAVKIIEKVVKIVDEFKPPKKFSSKKHSMLDAIFLEEALALFLAKLVQLPNASSKDGKSLPKPELNKIASQLTKSVTAEICKSNISLVATDPEEQFLNPESIEMISQVIDSVYSNVLQQSGTHEDLYYDIKGTNRVFPKKVASLIINGVSSFPLDTDDSKYSNVDLFRDLDLDRIVQKAQEHAVQMIPDREKEESDQDLVGEMPIKIVPHVGNEPIKVDPDIISEHLAVISIKTQPLEELKMECLRKTGHSIAEVRRASISGKSYSSSDTSNVGKMKKERRTSLNTMGRLDVKPLEVVCRNSFQNVRKPDIMKVELLKDVQSKKDLIIRLVAHDIEEESQSNIDEGLMFEEDEVVLGEVVPECLTDQVKATTKPIENTDVSPKPTTSTKSLKKFLSLSKCCQTTSSTIIESIEATSNHIKEPKEKEVKKAVAELDMATCSTITPVTDSWEKRLSHKVSEKHDCQ